MKKFWKEIEWFDKQLKVDFSQKSATLKIEKVAFGKNDLKQILVQHYLIRYALNVYHEKKQKSRLDGIFLKLMQSPEKKAFQNKINSIFNT